MDVPKHHKKDKKLSMSMTCELIFSGFKLLSVKEQLCVTVKTKLLFLSWENTSPRFVKKTTSPWLPLRCRWPSFLGMRIGVATSSELASKVWPNPLENSPAWNKLKGEWRQIEALKSCSRTGTPEVATAQQGRSTSIDPLTTVCSAPLAPTTCKRAKLENKRTCFCL